MEDEDMKYCKICLVTDCKMFSSPSISDAYSQLIQVVICDSYKLYVCYECNCLLNKCQEFKSKCIMALNVLSSINMDHSKIPKRFVRDIDRKHYKLESKLSHSYMFICSSNDQIVLPAPCLDSDVNIDIDTKYDASEDDNSDIKYINVRDPSSDVETMPIAETLPELEIKFDVETLDEVKTMPDIETLSEMETLPNIETQDTDNPNKSIQLNNEQNISVPERKSKQNCCLKSKKNEENVPKKEQLLIHRKIRKPSVFFEIIRDYTTIDVMTRSEAKKEMLLRKESRNYKTSPHKCDLCYRGFTMESIYNNHVIKSHNRVIGTSECDFCHCLFRTGRELRIHTETCHKYKIMCKFCPHVCFSPSQAKIHIAIHKGDTYTCELCEKSFRYSTTLANHKRKKHSECVCAHCGGLFVSLAGLKIHKRKEHKLDSTELLGPKCEECDVQFATETAWKRHLVLSSKHTVSNGCEECGDSFSTTDELKRHAMEHKWETTTRYVCKPCDTSLETYAEYKQHMMTKHTNSAEGRPKQKRQARREKKYVCEVCGRVFKANAQLQYHMNKHKGRLPYECDLCDKKYAHPTPLYQHKSSHHSSAPKPKCDICQKSFHNKNALRHHMSSVHLGVRRFKCDICNKLFRHQCEVKTHMEYVHFKKPWPKRDRTKRKLTHVGRALQADRIKE